MYIHMYIYAYSGVHIAVLCTLAWICAKCVCSVYKVWYKIMQNGCRTKFVGFVCLFVHFPFETREQENNQFPLQIERKKKKNLFYQSLRWREKKSISFCAEHRNKSKIFIENFNDAMRCSAVGTEIPTNGSSFDFNALVKHFLCLCLWHKNLTIW